MLKPLVSVIIPTYNHEQFIRLAVESVFNQSYINLELIAIDDASKDNTWAELQKLKNDRLRLYRHENNLGAHATLNEALGVARGDYITILNSDDLFDPKRIELLIDQIPNPNQDFFIFTDVEFINDQGDQVRELDRVTAYQKLCRFCTSQKPEYWFIAGNPAVTTSNFFFSRSLLQKVGPFLPLRYTHDWDWALRALRYVSPIWLNAPLLKYRLHGNNTLSEDDQWRHIHENSYLQSKTLLALLNRSVDNADTEDDAMATCISLLNNESCHPLALLCFLIFALAGVNEKRLLEFTRPQDERWQLQGLSEIAACPISLFRSIQFLAEQDNILARQSDLIEQRWQTIQAMSNEIASRDEVIAGQAQLIEQRWRTIQAMSSEIANRDECIAGQANLIEQRWQAIQTMSSEITIRDNQIINLENQLYKLHSDKIIRIALQIRKIFSRFGSARNGSKSNDAN